MTSGKSQESGGGPFGSFDPVVSAPSSISDVLYLIAAGRADVLAPETAERLSRANICFIRGDLGAALAGVDAVLAELDPAQPAFRDIVAFRLFLRSMIDQHADPRSDDVAAGHLDSGAPHIVALCVESDRQWNSGRLFQGLLLNQSAIQRCRQVLPVWRTYANLLLAKKLCDIHVSHQAARVIDEIAYLVETSGLHAFASLVPSTRSVLHLQAGDYDKAVRTAAEAVRVAEQRSTTVGVKLALSVSATAHLGMGDRKGAKAFLDAFHAESTRYVLTDSVARSAFVETALVASGEGPRAAAERIREKWSLLGTGSACFVEDVTRPAWLVSTARRADDTALARRCLDAIERLARDNPEISLLETAAEKARRAFDGGEVPSIFDCAGTGPTPAVSPPAVLEQPVPLPPEAVSGEVPDETGPAVVADRPTRLPPLSRREHEIARLVGRGMTNQQVAHELGLSPHTVNYHLRSIFRKFSISTRVTLGRILASLDRQQEPVIEHPPPPGSARGRS